MKKEETINFSLLNIKTEQFAILEENYNDKKSVEFGTIIQFKLDSKNHIIGVFLGITFDQAKKSFLKIEVSCHFNIENSSWNHFIDQDSSTITFPKGFLSHLSMITVGTTRGILFSKTEGSNFNKFIIPTINVTKIIEKDAKFSLS